MVKAEVAEDEGKATQSEGQASKRPRLVEGLMPYVRGCGQCAGCVYRSEGCSGEATNEEDSREALEDSWCKAVLERGVCGICGCAGDETGCVRCQIMWDRTVYEADTLYEADREGETFLDASQGSEVTLVPAPQAEAAVDEEIVEFALEAEAPEDGLTSAESEACSQTDASLEAQEIEGHDAEVEVEIEEYPMPSNEELEAMLDQEARQATFEKAMRLILMASRGTFFYHEEDSD